MSLAASPRRLKLQIAGADTLITSPLCANCPSGKAGCCAAPPAVAWADLGRIARHGGADWLLGEIQTGHLRPCPRGLAITRVEGPHGVACVYLGERGCVLPPERRSVTCNEYVCEDALHDAETAGDPAAARARKAHERLERALGEWDRAVADEVERQGEVEWNMAFLERLGEMFERVSSGRRSRRGLVLGVVGALALGSLGCAGQLPVTVPRAAEFDASRLEGGWHVLASTFPMWLEGNKKDPIFIYRKTSTSGPVELSDTVAYTESGRRETIEGTDTQDPQAPAHFTWRGKGLLAAFTSDWVVVHAPPDQRWIVLYFTKTLATPEGVDVIARVPVLTPEERAAVEKTIAGDPFLKGKAGGIVWLADRKGK